MYRGLINRTPARFLAVTALGFGGTLLVTLLIMAVGFATFGDECEDLILSNYHEHADVAATAARLATAASLAASFPLVFFALRESALSGVRRAFSLALPASAGSSLWLGATLLLPAASTLLALALPNLGLAVGILGSILGGALTYVFPALIRFSLARSRGHAVSLFDAVLLVYGVLAQCVAGTIITWKYRSQH